MSALGPKGRPPSTPEQVAECQKLIDAYRQLRKETAAGRKWRNSENLMIVDEGYDERRISLHGTCLLSLFRWLDEQAACIKGELFDKFGIEVS